MIGEDTTLGEVMLRCPEAAEVLAGYGMPVSGCRMPVSESLGVFAKSYVGGGEVAVIVDRINALIGAKGEKASVEGVEVSDAAVEKVNGLIVKEGKQGFNLRVEVKPGGCAGMSYEFSLDDEVKDGDVVVEKGGLKVVIDSASMENLRGATVDYVDGLQRSGFRVDNPNAHAVCSCGQSFG